MATLKKIYVNKNDEPTLIAEKIIDAEADEIILSIPKFSALAESVVNFHLLKREAEALGKRLSVESVDDRVVEYCRKSKIECVNPFFGKSQSKFSDIVSHVPLAAKEKIIPIKKEVVRDDEYIPKTKSHHTRSEEVLTKEVAYKKKGRWLSGRRLMFLSLSVILVVVVVFVLVRVLPKAQITLVAIKKDWTYSQTVTVSKGVAALDPTLAKIPGQLFTERKNLQIFYPATGTKQIERRASGKILIYNTYSPEPQSLVSRTRFVTPDGKVFRLVDRVVVPGVQVVDGKVVASKIEATVVADQLGEAYNIPPVPKLIIPGFQGTPKFDTFYGVSTQPMTGGLVGVSKYPTADDVKKAQAELATKLEEAIRFLTLAEIPGKFKLLEGTSKFAIVSQKTDQTVNPDGKFLVSGDGEFTVIVFKEEQLLDMLLARAENELSIKDLEVKDQTIAYGAFQQIDFKAGTMVLPVTYKSRLAEKIDPLVVKSKTLGYSEEDLKTTLSSVSGLESVRVSFWPFWVRHVPKNGNRVAITIN